MRKLRLLSMMIVGLLGLSVAHAASIKTVKGSQVLILTEGESFQEGQQLMAKDAQGKNRALVRIKKVGKAQAVADVLKGKAEAGYTIATRKPAAVDSTSTMEPVTALNRVTGGKKMGILGSYLNNTMTARYSLNSVNQTASMKGTGFGVLGYYDFPVARDFEVRGMGGVEQFTAVENKSTAVCDSGNSTTCNVNIMYLSMYGQLKYKFLRGKTNAWLGGGMGYLLAASKSSTVLDTSQISSNQVFTISAGFDMAIGKKKGILPVSIDYSLFPSSGTVSANMLAIRIGYGWGK